MIIKSIVYFNNEFISSDSVSISVDDRSFKFGDGVFETIKIANGKIIWWNDHLLRLRRGLELIQIKQNLNDLYQISNELIALNNTQDGFLRILINRGNHSLGYLPLERCKPNVLIQCVPAREVVQDPVKLWLSSYRKIPDICLPSNAKTVAGGLNSSLSRMEAVSNDCFESLMLSVDGNVAEGSSSNIFWLKNDKLYTPRTNIVEGVMRKKIIEFSEYEVIQGDFTIDDLQDAQEVFCSNASVTCSRRESLYGATAAALQLA